jgi:hypothetical protein
MEEEPQAELINGCAKSPQLENSGAILHEGGEAREF